MRILLIYLLFLGSLISCRSPQAGRYFNRPNFKNCITLFEKGKMACNGEVLDIPAKLTIPESQDEFELIKDYYQDHEQARFMCLRFSECN